MVYYVTIHTRNASGEWITRDYSGKLHDTEKAAREEISKARGQMKDTTGISFDIGWRLTGYEKINYLLSLKRSEKETARKMPIGMRALYYKTQTAWINEELDEMFKK